MGIVGRRWYEIDWEYCPECGGIVEAYTHANDGCVFDGDSVRCAECGLSGYAMVDEGDVLIEWHYAPPNAAANRTAAGAAGPS